MSTNIPCVLMRGGTSRGPFFLADWLPQAPEARDRTLIAALGSPHELQIDGLGGGNSLTSKVAIVSRSTQPDCDVDYLFAQVSVQEARVDTRPNCGNMLAGVGPFAIEQGLVSADRESQTTTVRVYNVNTRSRIDVQVCTAGGQVHYDGDVRIDGVQGTAAPVLMNFLDAWGAVTGQIFPTGQRIDTIQGLQVTCIDAAQVMVLVRAADLGLRGDEAPVELDANTALLARLEDVHIEAGQRMGMGDVTHSVLPKPVIVSPGAQPASVVSRYFTPHKCHRSHAVTGAIGVAAASVLPGTVATDERHAPAAGLRRVEVQHPAGRIQVEVELSAVDGQFKLVQAALVRTARKILEGTLFVPESAPAHWALVRAPLAQRPSNDFNDSNHYDRRQTMTRSIHSTTRRTALATAALAIASSALWAAGTAHAAFPDKPITLVVPTAAGGGNDGMARVVALKLSNLLGQQVIVENKAGANGAIAAEYVARAAPDGHTILFGYIGTHGMSPALQKLRYDPITQFEPIGMVSYSPTLMVVNPKVTAKTVSELVALTKAKPHDFNYASAGNGTAPHFSAEIFKLESGAQMAHVPYRGAAPAMNDTMAGQTQVMFPSLFSAYPHVKSGKLRALALAGPKRSSLLPDVPTLEEAGVKGVEITQWYALFAPGKTPRPVIDLLNKTLNTALADKDVVRRIEEQGAVVDTSTPEQLALTVKQELAKWKGVVIKAQLTPD